MLFSAIVILLIGVVAYYHYTQGLFTSAISLGCAIFATLIAFGYYEDLAAAAGQGKMIDLQAGALLMMLFGVTYLLLRIIFDALVPGNVSFPLYVDRAGAGVCGFIVGVLGAGTFAVALQLMPMGPKILMANRFESDDRPNVIIPAAVFGGGIARSKDTGVAHELVTNSLDPAGASNLWVPADGWTLSIVGLASGGGLGGSQSFPDVHPDLLTEAFSARLGADGSTNHTIYNSNRRQSVDVSNVYTLPAGVTGLDTEVQDIRPDKKVLTMASKSTDGMLVVRATFQDEASDKDGVLRITPAEIRLVVDGVNYHPIGTMANANTIGLNRLDDQIPVQMSGKFHGADFVFDLPKAITTKLLAGGKGVRPETAFVEFKLFGRVDLSGKPTGAYPGLADTISVLRKPQSPLGAVVTPKPKDGN